MINKRRIGISVQGSFFFVFIACSEKVYSVLGKGIRYYKADRKYPLAL